MPKYTYRLKPALAIAFGVAYQPGEWVFFLRARAEAAAVELQLKQAQAEQLQHDLLAVAESFSGERFPLNHVQPVSPDDPALRLPTDLEAPVANLQVGRHPCRRLMFIQAEGQVDGMPYEVEIWATPEQMLAAAGQIDDACIRADSHCPICGEPLGETPHVCPAGSVTGDA